MEEEPIDRTSTARNTAEIAFVTDDEAIKIQPLAEESLKSGDQFIFRETFTRSTTDPNLQVLIQQPEGAEDTVRVIGRSFESNKALVGTLSFNVDIPTSGTDFSQVNAKITDPLPTPENVAVEYGGGYDKTAGYEDKIPFEILDTGVGPNRRALDTSRGAFRLTPGSNILYDVDAQVDDTDIFVEFIVSERPEQA